MHEKTGKYDLQVDFRNFQNRNVEKRFSAVKRIEQTFVIQGTLNGRVGSGRPRAFTIKHDSRL